MIHHGKKNRGNHTKIEGIIPAMVTLFKEDQEIDETALREHIDFLIENGVHGIFALGTNGEFVYLSKEEKKQVLEITADQVNGRVALIAGISSHSTKISVELAKYAEDLGVTAVMAILPTYYPLENKNVQMYYEEIASAIEIPLYAYNFPMTNQLNLSPKLVAKLAEQKILAGIKETVMDINHIKQMIESTPDDFIVINGSELLLDQALKAGVDGAIHGMANCFPKKLVQIWDAFQNKKPEFNNYWQEFKEAIPLLNVPMDYLPSLTKEILVAMGRDIVPQVRSPLRIIKDRWRKKIKDLKLLKAQ